MQTEIREMSVDDLDDIVKLEHDLFTTPWSRRSIQTSLEHGAGISLVIEAEKKLIGYAFLIIVLDEAHLTNIAISGKYQKQGIGQKFIEYIIENVRVINCKYIFLEVRASNIPAINLYRKNGFFNVGIRKEYYTDNKEDAILMTKLL